MLSESSTNSADTASTAAVDGRTQRTAVTRRRILDATRALLVTGASDLTAADIAAEAGITTRTLFRHFNDMESLYAAVVQEAHTSIAAVMDEPFGVDGSAGGASGASGTNEEEPDWRDLLQQIIERRVRVYEFLLPIYVSSAWLRGPGGLNSVDQRKAIRRRRLRLRQVLPAEVASDEVLFEALDATLSIEFWLSLRRGQKLGVDRAAQVLRRAVGALSAAQ